MSLTYTIMINSWYCDSVYNNDTPPLIVGENCSVTSSSTQAVLPISSPLIVRDDGTVVFGLGIIIFFLSVLFFATLFGSFDGLKPKV